MSEQEKQIEELINLYTNFLTKFKEIPKDCDSDEENEGAKNWEVDYQQISEKFEKIPNMKEYQNFIDKISEDRHNTPVKLDDSEEAKELISKYQSFTILEKKLINILIEFMLTVCNDPEYTDVENTETWRNFLAAQ